MTDRELLELAAKAYGLTDAAWRNIGHGCIETAQLPGFRCYWTPLADDGDALRLAVKLGIQIRQYPIYDQPRFAAYACEARWDCDAQKQVGAEALVNYDGDPCAATRRAIVLAAAEIGRSMK